MSFNKYILVLFFIFYFSNSYSQNIPIDINKRVRQKDKRLPNFNTSQLRTTRNNTLDATTIDTVQFETSSSDTTYSITLAGKLDWQNTYTHYNTDIDIVFQPNLKLTLENTGENLLINPHIFQQGRNYNNLNSIVESFTKNAKTDLDELYLIWNNVRKNSYHSSPLFYNNELHDVVKFFNSYGMGICDDISQSLIPIYYTAKLHGNFQNINPYNRDMNGHFMAESAYKNKNRFMDPDIEVFFLDRENELPVSADEISEDHDLARREVVFGQLFEGWEHSESFASMFGKDDVRYDREYPNHSMNFVLRPGEKVIYNWDNIGKHIKQFAYHKIEPSYYGNSKFEYVPKFSSNKIEESLIESYNVEFDKSKNQIYSNKDSAAVAFNFQYPYAIVGGTIVGKYNLYSESEVISVQLKMPGGQFKEIGRYSGKKEDVFVINIDSYLQDIVSHPYYNYQVRINLIDKQLNNLKAPRLLSLKFQTDVMCWPLSLPQLQFGENNIHIAHESKEEVKFNIQHIWQEHHDYQVPLKPSLSYPQNNLIVSDSIILFKWNKVQDCKRYHFQVSLREDFLYPYRPSFDVIVDSLQWGAPFLGMFSPDTVYYWRVRAQDGNQVWSEWSDTNNFQWTGPRVPLDVKVVKHPADPNKLVLSWRPNSRGNKPVKYEIYASNEKGFKVSKTPFTSITGATIEENFITTTTDTAFVIHDYVDFLDGSLKSFYRVIAVDQAGGLSGSSNLGSISTPNLIKDFAKILILGDTLDFVLDFLKSDGDLQYRYQIPHIDYWEKEDYSVVINELPDWLRYDISSNKILGKATKSGKYKVNIKLEDKNSSKYLGIVENIWVLESPSQLFYSINKREELKPLLDTVYLFKQENTYFELPWIKNGNYKWFDENNKQLGSSYNLYISNEGNFRSELSIDYETVINNFHVKFFTERPRISSGSMELSCEIDSVRLDVNFKEIDKINAARILWFKDFEEIKNEHEKNLFIKSPGKYHYEIYENNAFRASSDTIEIIYNYFKSDTVELILKNNILFGPEGFEYYTWKKDGVLYKKTLRNLLKIKESGFYELTVEGEGKEECIANIPGMIVDKQEGNIIKEMYFNYSNNELIINNLSEESQDFILNIYSTTGQIVYTKSFFQSNDIERVDIHLPQGLFIATISFATGDDKKIKFIIY